MRKITDSLLLTYLSLRVANGSLVRRVSEGILFALFILSVHFRSSGSES